MKGKRKIAVVLGAFAVGGVAAIIHKRRYGEAPVEELEEGAVASDLRAREPSAARERG